MMLCLLFLSHTALTTTGVLLVAAVIPVVLQMQRAVVTSKETSSAVRHLLNGNALVLVSKTISRLQFSAINIV